MVRVLLVLLKLTIFILEFRQAYPRKTNISAIAVIFIMLVKCKMYINSSQVKLFRQSCKSAWIQVGTLLKLLYFSTYTTLLFSYYV